MNHKALIALLTLGLVVGGPPAWGQAEEDEQVYEETQQQLDAARRKLEEAAREVAALSGRIVPQIVERFAFSMPDGKRAMLGIAVSGERDSDGVGVSGVTPDGPADDAGIESGDVLLEIDGKSLSSEGDQSSYRLLVDHMREVEPGDTVTVKYRRGNETRETRVETGKFGSQSFAFRFPGNFDFNVGEDFELLFDDDGPLAGMRHGRHFLHHWGRMELVELTPKLGSYFGSEEGLLVVRGPESEALEIEEGDVILSIGGRHPGSAAHAMRILRSYQPGEELQIEILRNKRRQTLDLNLPESRSESRSSKSSRHNAPSGRATET